MHNNVKALLATTVLFFSSQSMASGGCAFEGQQEGFMATCSEEKQEVILTGSVTTEQLNVLDWFNQEYTDYKADKATVAQLQAVTEATEITVIIGTWCPDCHRETPRLIRIMEQVNNPLITVKYIGVDRAKEDPKGLAKHYDFSRIPTFIVSQKDEEIGRIVERPKVSLEKDLAAILKAS
ncbi:thiol reductase thioredoxin [Shewanella sp. Choline-02u-19]|jgi:thiol-disulfide isomerase/thioredoxin|uniref:thioredoxin family protein n=1 Tax=unclassified Shewanella TaxID=196818 RepID=UPI000C334608|nr:MULTISPECIES: thioredoxin family protein [unclassified Shewanella]PKG55794.1 thiol reductase thioredoxin [Shewanella sp. GutDb-MelDb]PKG74982.1 thiol reductase thioredoxin [Shewanella sp. GutCb]PKH58796.1 thiol reductase thioredoxin [Shewanella sp. Bg11-22]PKI29057.1 thiol reductase thioredoxin [Shewanella sp. Choline-02u-19]